MRAAQQLFERALAGDRSIDDSSGWPAAGDPLLDAILEGN
jgi:hypothetical protein